MGAASTVKGGASIDAAAGKLAAAAYPLIKDVNWTSDLFSKPIPGQAPQDVLKAVDKMIVMGAAMDGAALQEAAKAHVKAIEGVDAKGVLSEGDFAAINAGLGKAISSVPTSTVMDVYNAMGKVVGGSPVPNYLFSLVSPQDAQAAYNALLEFKDVVKAAPKMAVGAFASEESFDPVGLKMKSGDSKHGRYSLMAAAAGAASLAAPGVARADEIGDAAAKLSKAAYPFMKEVPWNSTLYSIQPGSADAVSWAKAIGKMIDMGAAMDPQLLKAGAKAHHDAIQGLPANGVASIDAAAGKPAAAAYPLVKDVNWTSDLFSKPIPGQAPQDVLKAVDKMIVMGAAMDGAALQEAARAHVKAIEGADAKGVLSQADFEAINAGLGKAISSVPTATVMDVYNSMAKVVGGSPVPNYLFSTVNPQDALAAYNALLDFKDVVKAAQR